MDFEWEELIIVSSKEMVGVSWWQDSKSENLDSVFLPLGVSRGLPGLTPSFLGPPDQGKQGLAWLILGKQVIAATAGPGYREHTGRHSVDPV